MIARYASYIVLICLYRSVSPFTYLVSALLSVGLAHAPVQCSSIELRIFNPRSGQTCGQYMAAFINETGGSVSNPAATVNCEYCPLTTTDSFLKSVNADFHDRWRNFGLMMAYIAFNVTAALFLYWLVRVPKNGTVEKAAGSAEQNRENTDKGRGK
jgi:ATP-binding cassette, subfamily G (WHITE), member 2, PDR